jgi:hypothetical protein
MRTICLFASYFTDKDLPYYITIYLKELKNHFTDVVLLGSQQNISNKSIEFLKLEGISYHIEKNEGFDFGLWYKAFQKIDVDNYEQVALVNDSCILFKPLDDFISWSNVDLSDVKGMTYSDAIAPHIQSYFMILNKKAVELLKHLFRIHRIIQNISEVIRTYEVGLSTYFISKGLTMSAFMGEENSSGEYSPYYSHVKEHLKKGIPLIKKKIIFSSYRKDEFLTLARMNFNLDVNEYVTVIKQHNTMLIISFERLLNSETNKLSNFFKIKYNFTRLIIQVYRKLRYGR